LGGGFFFFVFFRMVRLTTLSNQLLRAQAFLETREFRLFRRRRVLTTKKKKEKGKKGETTKEAFLYHVRVLFSHNKLENTSKFLFTTGAQS
jgi:hypothetical protein